MNKFSKWQILATVAVVIILFFVAQRAATFGGGLIAPDSTLVVVATSTLTNTFTDTNAVSSTPRDVRGMRNLVIAGEYFTKHPGSILYLKLQQSFDHGVTYKDYSVPQDVPGYGGAGYLNASITSSTVLAVGATSTSGIPWVIGDRSVASGTTISFSFPVNGFKSADFIKVIAQESSTGTHGQLSAQVLLTN